MDLAVEYHVRAVQQRRLDEAEARRAARAARAGRPRPEVRRRPTWAHLPDVAGLVTRLRHTPAPLA